MATLALITVYIVDIYALRSKVLLIYVKQGAQKHETKQTKQQTAGCLTTKEREHSVCVCVCWPLTALEYVFF